MISYGLHVHIVLQLLGILVIQIMRVVAPSMSVFFKSIGREVGLTLIEVNFHGGYIEHSKVDDHLYALTIMLVMMTHSNIYIYMYIHSLLQGN